MNVIKNNIKIGIIIYSDCWRAYKTEELEKAGFNHLTVNRAYNFVDPATSAHTQNIERLWGSTKWQNKKHWATFYQYPIAIWLSLCDVKLFKRIILLSKY